MCIYCGTNKYRKIYESHNGPIPVDKDGRSYEIHHIDGDHSNNNITNLTVVSIQEHYDIHYSQCDYGACFKIAKRMDMKPDQIAEIARMSANKQVANGTHPWLSGIHQRANAQKRLAEGTHNLLDGTVSSLVQKAKVAAGTHHFLGGDIQRANNIKRITNGTHPFLGPNSPSQLKWTCEHCGKEGKGKGNYIKNHGLKCKKR
jgi:hypothetical protein